MGIDSEIESNNDVLKIAGPFRVQLAFTCSCMQGHSGVHIYRHSI